MVYMQLQGEKQTLFCINSIIQKKILSICISLTLLHLALRQEYLSSSVWWTHMGSRRNWEHSRSWHECKVRTQSHRQHLIQGTKIQRSKSHYLKSQDREEANLRTNWSKSLWDRRDSVIVKLYALLSYHLCGLNNNALYIVLLTLWVSYVIFIFILIILIITTIIIMFFIIRVRENLYDPPLYSLYSRLHNHGPK